ncbi:Hypothetical protein CINCED_3A005496 [Cinara cedri]|uniref:Uncharacterized protein n=1 Tax=Cinara cedri TaxID=506608 RepID=A0A5E4NHY9_9HEMI|nr:Hypothetical protein CINCED_3A005496 [Cinara cedri]
MTRFEGRTGVCCLSIACLLLQVGSGVAGPTTDATATKPSTTAGVESMAETIMVDLSSEAEAAANRVKSAFGETSTTLNSIMDLTTDSLSGLIKNTGTTALDFSSETSKSLEEIIKAGGRVTLAIGNLCNELFGGVSAGLATGTDLLAMGTNNLDSFLGGVPVVGVVTGGLNGLMSGVSTTVNQMSNTGRESRQQLMKKLRSGINQSYLDTNSVANSVTNGATNVDTTAAAGSVKATVNV